jgi:hypothetical protein
MPEGAKIQPPAACGRRSRVGLAINCTCWWIVKMSCLWPGRSPEPRPGIAPNCDPWLLLSGLAFRNLA